MSIGSISRSVRGRHWPPASWRLTNTDDHNQSVPSEAAESVRELRQLTLAVLALLVPALLLLVSGILAGMPAEAGKIERGVRVAGVAVDGDQWDARSSELVSRFDAYLDQPLTLIVGERMEQISPRDLGLSFDLEATQQRGLAIGRGMFISAAAERLNAHMTGVDLDPVVKADPSTLRDALEALGTGTIAPATDARFSFSNNQLVIEPSAPGTAIDAAATMIRLRKAVASLSTKPVEVATVLVEPAVATDDLERVRDQAQAVVDEPLLLHDENQQWQILPEAVVDLLIARDGALAVDTKQLEPIIRSLSSSIDTPSKAAEIVYNGDGTFRIEPEVKSRKLDVAKTVAAIERGVLTGEHQIELVERAVAPAIVASELEPLLERVNQIAANGMKVRWSDGEAELDKATYAGTIVVDEQASEITFDHEALFHLLEPIAHGINRPATGYRWKYWEVVAPEGSLPGRLTDINASIGRITANALAGQPTAELVVDEQDGITEIASQVVITDMIGTASTYYGNSSANRKTNVEVGAAALDGALVPPHGTFSFNQAIGGTTSLDDGYQMGYGIILGDNGIPKTVPSVAGGICQVATTTFQSAFWAGMPIGTRNWHLYWIPNYGSGPGGLKGLDATVDPDYGLDFTFENPTDDWLAIRAIADGEWLTVEVWGVNQGWEVTADEPVISNVVKANTEWVRQQSDQIPAGEEVVVEHAEDGFTAAIHRVVKKDGEVINETTLTSYYLPSRNVVLVGTGAPAEPQPEQASEPPAEQPAEQPTEEPTPVPTETPTIQESPSPEVTEEPEPAPTETPTEESVQATPSE